MSLPLPTASQATVPFDYGDDEPYDSDALDMNVDKLPLVIIPESTIYYLVIHMPPTHVIDILGPFATRAGFILRLTNYLTIHCPPGLSLLNETIASQTGIDSFVQIGMTVPGPEGRHTMDIYLHKEDNEDVKAILPRPVWTVICTKMEDSIGPEEGPIVKGREVLSTYPHTNAGEREAKNLARETAEAKIASGQRPYARIITSGLRGVNVVYNVVGVGGGWSIEANLHSRAEIVSGGASDMDGLPMVDEGILNASMLLQQHMDDQWSILQRHTT
jgi:hypothetical protein